jgi:hypothetical protein
MSDSDQLYKLYVVLSNATLVFSFDFYPVCQSEVMAHLVIIKEWLQQLAVPKAWIETVLFWDVLEEFPISRRVPHPFT